MVNSPCGSGSSPSEPLLNEVDFVAELSDRLLDQAEERYTARFDAGHGPEGPEGPEGGG